MLAEHLHMTVGDLRTRMGNQEYVAWNVFFQLRAAEQKAKEDAAWQHR